MSSYQQAVEETQNALMRDAENWRKLMRIAGHWQDGSDTVITLQQDDCTRQAIITVKTVGVRFPTDYAGSSFESALSKISE